MSEDSHQKAAIDQQIEEFLAVWFKVRQQVQGLNFNRAHQHGMSMTQFVVLGLLEEAPPHEPATITWLAGRMNLDPATVLRSVDSLEKRGLVERRRDKKDRRLVFVEFTEEGRTTQRSSHQGFKDRIANIFNSMSVEGRTALIKGLQEFAAAGEREMEGHSSAE